MHCKWQVNGLGSIAEPQNLLVIPVGYLRSISTARGVWERTTSHMNRFHAQCTSVAGSQQGLTHEAGGDDKANKNLMLRRHKKPLVVLNYCDYSSV